MPENIEQVYRGRLGTLCSANIDHRFHHSICHGATTLNGLISPSSHLNDRQSTKFSIRKNMFSVCSSSRNANPTARLPPPTTPTSLHANPRAGLNLPRNHNTIGRRTGQVLLLHNPANPRVILNLHRNPHTIGEHFVPENIEQVYRGTRETSRHKLFSDCIRISGEIQDRCRVQNRPSADPKTRRIGAQAIGTKKDTPKRTRILPFREFAIRRNPCIHFLQLRAIVAGL